MIKEIISRLRFWRTVDRIGPDILGTHWRLHLKPSMQVLCKKKFAAFGESAEFRAGAYAISCSKIYIGDRVVIRPGTMLFADPRDGGAGITIENDVLIGSGVHIYVNNHEFGDSGKPIIFQGHAKSLPVLIKSGAWIGANTIILPGVQIGNNAVIGAGSVVTKSIPDFSLASGNPCRIIMKA